MAITGGDITTSGNYVIHTFTSDGTFETDRNLTTDVLLVAGGGGGSGGAGRAGGGGAGGVKYQTGVLVTTGSYSVQVGAGGSAAVSPNQGGDGEDSTFNSLTAHGGGGSGVGPNGRTPDVRNGRAGGSGGGSASYAGAGIKGSGISGEGYDGGTALEAANGYGGGGGGGASEVGHNGTSSAGGNGGDGVSNSISGSSVTYGGGGGGAVNVGTKGLGGAGGGGNGGIQSSDVPTAGEDGKGGGGGGGPDSAMGAKGGSGVVIIRYLSNNVPNTPTNSTPANASTNISRNPTLTGSAFSDPDSGDTHANSQWLVATDSGFSDTVWDSGETSTNKTSVTVNSTNGTFGGTRAGKTVLAGNTTHYWKVRYQDNNGGWSSYSSATNFTTLASPATPSITSPSNGATNVSRNPTITSSAFSSSESFTHSSSTWQIATDSGFSSVVWSKASDTSNKTSIVVNATNGTFAGALSGKTKLAVSTEYYVHVKYTDSGSDDSAYSTGISFTTIGPTLIKNGVLVEHFAKYPVTVSKPSMIGVSEEDSTDSVSAGTARVQDTSGDLEWKTTAGWKRIADKSSYPTLSGNNSMTGTNKFGTSQNYLQIDNAGKLLAKGTSTWYDDLRIEPVARTSGTGAPAFEKWYDDAAGTSRGVFLYSFTDESVLGNEKEIFFTMQMPHGWASTVFSIHVHWIGSSTQTSQTPRWGLEYCMKEIGAVFGDTTIIYATGNVENDTGVTANHHYLTKFADITPDTTQDGLSTVLIGRLFRSSSHVADTYNGHKCGLLYIDAHIEYDQLGSNDEFVK